MTTYTTLSNITLAQDKPWGQSTTRALRDNPLAIAEGDASAPVIVGLNPLGVQTASASANLSFTSLITSAHEFYELELINLKPSATGNLLRMELSLNNGSSYPHTVNIIGENTGGGTGICGIIRLFDPASALAEKIYTVDVYNATSGSGTYYNLGASYNTGGSAVNAVRFNFSTGNITSGKIVLRGRRKA